MPSGARNGHWFRWSGWSNRMQLWPSERLGVGRGAMAVEIGGSRAHDAAMVGQAASDQGFVVHRTQAKGEVDALADQIDPAIGEGELQLDIGVARRELGHQRHDLAHAEAVAQADAQGAARAQPARADELLGGIQLVEQLACTLVEQPAFGRWRHTARGPLQQPGAEPIFQAGEELADRRGRQARGSGAAPVRLPCSTTWTNTAISPARLAPKICDMASSMW